MKEIRKNQLDALKSAFNTYEWEKQTAIELQQESDWGDKDKPVTFGINWAACGTQNPENTLAFARYLGEYAVLAQRLNEQEYKEGPREEITPENREQKKAEYQQMEKEIYDILMSKGLYAQAIIDWIGLKGETA